MAKWRYEGFNSQGKRISGEQEGKTLIEVKRALRSQGIRPIKMIPPSIFDTDLAEWLIEKGFARPFGNKELAQVTRQLSIMINAGVPILLALEILFKQEKQPVLKSSLKKIATEVREGKTISEALSKQQGFSRLYCNLVKAGETGGILDRILEKLAVFLEKQEKIKSQIKSALTYPTIVVIVGIAVIYAMMVFVVPKFTEMLTESGQEVPAITQFVINASEFLQSYSLYLVPGVLFAGFLFTRFIKTPEGKPGWDRFIMKVPIFGGIVIKGNLATFTRTLATLLAAGVSLVDSLEICNDILDNEVMRKDMQEVRKLVTQGKTLSEPIMRITYFPDMIAQMVKVGETTGNLDNMLERVGDMFEAELNDLIGNMTKLIEPLILVGLGGVVAVILIAMYLPIFMSAGGAPE